MERESKRGERESKRGERESKRGERESRMRKMGRLLCNDARNPVTEITNVWNASQ